MNGMNFKPFIAKLLDSLSDEQLKQLYDLINSHSNNFKKRSLIDSSNLLTTSDKGIGLYTIQLDSETIKTGYLIYNNTYCVLLGYVSNSERVSEYVIDMTKKTWSMVKEFITTDYFRHEVAIRTVVPESGVTEAELQAALTKYQKIVRAKFGQPTTQDVIDKLKTGEYLLIYENANNKPNIFVPAQSTAHIYLYSILAERANYLTAYSISVESLNTTDNFNTFISSANNYQPIFANPSLEGTENALTGLQVGNTKYKVSGGTKLYIHTLEIEVSSPDYDFISLFFYSKYSQTITDADDLIVYFVRPFSDGGFVPDLNSMMLGYSGKVLSVDHTGMSLLDLVILNRGSTTLTSFNINLTGATFSDTVTEL